MHITVEPYIPLSAGILWLDTLSFIFAIVGLIVAIVWFVRYTEGGRKRGDLIATIVSGSLAVIFAIVATVSIVHNVHVGETQAAAFRAQLTEQAQNRYDLDLNQKQVRDLTYRATSGYDPSPLGTTDVLMGNRIQEVALYHVGNDWILSNSGEGKQITELPVKAQ